MTNLVADVQENNLEAYITWDAPTVGLNGGYVDPEGITYWLCTYDKVTDSYKQYAELGKIPEYPMFVKEGKLATYDVIIQAVSSAGASSEYASTRVQLGTPFTLGINEDFIVNGKPGINYNPISHYRRIRKHVLERGKPCGNQPKLRYAIQRGPHRIHNGCRDHRLHTVPEILDHRTRRHTAGVHYLPVKLHAKGKRLCKHRGNDRL